MCGGPLGFVTLDVLLDLGGAAAERAHERRELGDLPGRVQGVAVRGQDGPELRVANDGGMPDPVDRGGVRLSV